MCITFIQQPAKKGLGSLYNYEYTPFIYTKWVCVCYVCVHRWCEWTSFFFSIISGIHLKMQISQTHTHKQHCYVNGCKSLLIANADIQMYTITRAEECRDLNESKSVKKLCGLCYCYIAESIFIYFYGFFTQSVSHLVFKRRVSNSHSLQNKIQPFEGWTKLRIITLLGKLVAFCCEKFTKTCIKNCGSSFYLMMAVALP